MMYLPCKQNGKQLRPLSDFSKGNLIKVFTIPLNTNSYLRSLQCVFYDADDNDFTVKKCLYIVCTLVIN